ncbi:MAG: ABC-F family ATP-binding cassette domain-containing protein [Clostridiales bacterium]|nr:ABC-F family ATP-binding cassette domain-containing protein [Clostridiales bacterium]
MIVLSATDITKEYGTDIILKDVSFHVNGGDRIGLIGANGAGKTTLMKILAGEMSYEKGNYFISQDLTVGYLKQNDDFKSERTVYEEAYDIFKHLQKMEEDIHSLSDEIAELSANGEDVTRLLTRLDQLQIKFENDGGYTYKSEINGILQSMAFSEDFYNKKISTLSGGERTRLSLACLLLKKPDILMLDEPTNHLDIGTLKWLEQYLKGYKGTIIVISHDRYFLDQLVNRIFEVENHKLYTYNGNYSTFADQKAARRESEMRAYEKQQTEIARQEEIIRRFKQHNTEHLTKRALSREKMLEHMELIEKPENLPDKIKISFRQNYKSGNDVLIGEGIGKGFGSGNERRELFRNVNFDIKRGERICIVGANGIGKTTLLKIMMEELDADAGRLKIGHNVDFGYYDQGQRLLNNRNTVLEELKESYRLYTDTEMRNILGRFLFRGDDVFLDVGSLSGGEKARLSLLKMMLAGSNTLLLDEPTNHLDIDSKEIFEEALLDFPGTVIVVSHDRYFLNKIPTRILELTPDGIEEYLGTYDYYVEKKQSMITSGKSYLSGMATQNTQALTKFENAPQKAPGETSGLSAAEERQLKKDREREERRLTKAIEKVENEISTLEAEIEEITKEISKPEIMTDHKALSDLNDRLEKANSRLEECYEEWDRLVSEK